MELPANAATRPGGIEVQFVFVQAGEFVMGGELDAAEVVKRFGGQADGYKLEKPQHRVKLSNGFLLGAHEVTRAQFALFAADTGYRTDAERGGTGCGMSKEGWKELPGLTWKKPGIDQTDDHPVVQVSWNDATAFCTWLSGKLDKPCRLPTEAEWEYACRAGKQTIFPWGDTVDDGKGSINICDKSAQKWFDQFGAKMNDRVPWDDGWATTAPVGQFLPNAWGLADMTGNVWEWCSDWYGNYPKDDVTDPQGPPHGTLRVLRGGSWNCEPRFCRCAHRGRYVPIRRDDDVGFRVVMELR
jgi:formylglycine-generating enzyme required for sulfatase activity